MKIVLLVFLYSLLTIRSNCQDSTISLSGFEKFITQPEKILKTDSKEIGSSGSLIITKVKATDISAGNHFYALTIANTDFDIITSMVNPDKLYIDSDELDSIITAFTYFIKESNIPKATSNVNYLYITSADIEVFGYCPKNSDNWRFGIGKVYQKLRTTVPGSLLTFNKKRIVQFVELLTHASALKW